MPPDVNWDMILTIQVLEEVMQVFMKFITWIIKCTPFAIISLIAAAIGAQTNLGEIFTQLGVLVTAICVGLLTQFLLVYCGFYLGFVRKNPFKYYKHTVPAMMVSFATSSSAATIPVSIDCAVSSGDVPNGVARFVVPLGATINMDGGTIYSICGSVWMAYQNVRLLLLAWEESPLFHDSLCCISLLFLGYCPRRGRLHSSCPCCYC
jgi:Na+/H+-dicarboxylate symporter